MTKRQRWVLVAVTLVTIACSTGRWLMEGLPRKAWRDGPTRVSAEYCPDGMDLQIEQFAEVLKGSPDGWNRYLTVIRHSHQASTYLVGVLAAPLVCLGVPAPVAFAVLSLVASLLLLGLLARLVGEVLANAPGWQLAVLLLFLIHPATIRCFVRPQTDALMALFAFTSLFYARQLVKDPTRAATWGLLCLTQSLACFVKIHGLALLLVPPAIAFLMGSRGRVILATLVWGTLLPAGIWSGLFAALGLFGTIGYAWDYLDQFYSQWTFAHNAKVLALTVVPLLIPALLHPRLLGGRTTVDSGPKDPADTPSEFRSGLPATLLLLVGGFAAIMVVCELPPRPRFQFPGLAPLVFLAVLGIKERFGKGLVARSWVSASFGLFLLISAGLIYIDLYSRYFGRTKDLAPLDTFLIHFL